MVNQHLSVLIRKFNYGFYQFLEVRHMKKSESFSFYEHAAKTVAARFGPVTDWGTEITGQDGEDTNVRLTSPLDQGIIDVKVHPDGSACVEAISGLTVEPSGKPKTEGLHCYYCDCPRFSGDGIFCNRATCQHHWITHPY